MILGIQLNDDTIQIIDTISKDYKGGDRSCAQWAEGVLEQIHSITWTASAKAGQNRIIVYACDPGVVLERIVVRQEGTQQPEGYIGILPKQ